MYCIHGHLRKISILTFVCKDKHILEIIVMLMGIRRYVDCSFQLTNISELRTLWESYLEVPKYGNFITKERPFNTMIACKMVKQYGEFFITSL